MKLAFAIIRKGNQRMEGFGLKTLIRRLIALSLFIMICPAGVHADETLALYGLKGYAYTWSPLPVEGLHLQTGGMYAIYHERNVDERDGYIWTFPLSVTYGNGSVWEVAAASHMEYWKNTDYDVDESGFGDLFLGGKFRFLNAEKGHFADMAVTPYWLIATGDREKSIGDFYLFNPTDEDDITYGINLTAGRLWRRFYGALNIGWNHIDSDLGYIKNDTLLLGAALEYHVSETINTYMELIYNENKNQYICGTCDEDANEDFTEIGIGAVGIKGRWGLKVHIGAGLTPTTPDVRLLTLINRGF